MSAGRPASWRAVAMLAAVAVAPLVVSAVVIAVRRPDIAWTGDRALTELAVRQAAGFHQLLGIGGRFGWRHPGPIWMYLLLPGYEVAGRAPWSLAVGAIGLHLCFAVIAIAAAGRAGGRRAAAVVAALTAWYLAATGLSYWTNLWAGYAFTWPVLALVVLGAVAGSSPDAGWALPAAALVGTFLVQTDVSSIVVVGAVGLTAAGLRLVRAGPRSLLGDRDRWLSPAALGLVVLVAIAWVPPLVEQMRSHPGNLTLLARFGSHPSSGHPLRASMAATGAALSVLPFGARWVLRNGVELRLGAGPRWAVGLTVTYLAVTAAATVVAWRRGRRLAGDLGLLSVVAIVAAVVAMSRVTGPMSFYLLTWITILPVPALTSVALAAAPEAPVVRGPPAGDGGAQRVDAIVLAGLAVAAVMSGWLLARSGPVQDYDRTASTDALAATANAESQLGAAARDTVRVHVVTPDAWQLAAGVGLQLQRQGARLEVDPDWVFLFGDPFRPGAGPPGAELWFARPHELPLVTGLPRVVDIGRFAGVAAFVRRDDLPAR
jgi:hypothetical protein